MSRGYVPAAAGLMVLASFLAACGGGPADDTGVLPPQPYLGETPRDGGAMGVNSFLWRASLDTIAFMPLASADPFGGVIITDWYTAPETPNERFKVTVYILDQRLRADGIKVAVFRQQQSADGTWIDAPVAPETAVQLENAILTRARELRMNAVG